MQYTVNLEYKYYNLPVGTSVFCPLYTKSVLRVYRTLSVIRIYRTLSGICIPYIVRYTLSNVQLHAYIMFHLGYYVFKSFIVTGILHCDCFKSSINKQSCYLNCLFKHVKVTMPVDLDIGSTDFQIPHVQLEMKS